MFLLSLFHTLPTSAMIQILKNLSALPIQAMLEDVVCLPVTPIESDIPCFVCAEWGMLREKACVAANHILKFHFFFFERCGPDRLYTCREDSSAALLINRICYQDSRYAD